MTPARASTVIGSAGLRAGLAALAFASAAYGGSHVGWHVAVQAREHALAPLAHALGHERAAKEARLTLDSYRSRYAQLRERGVVDGQLRFEWAEAVNTTARRLALAVHYELAPAQTLEEGTAVTTEINPMQLVLALRHEGDLLGFVDVLSQTAPGVLRVRRCELERAPAAHGLRARCRFDWLVLRTNEEGAP